MIIKGLFKRYERWNPVHPTSGAFWGMGIGIGCGVGWGPGFGPDVIGYVGAGCGVGFSVGFTIAGIGIGLPANYLFEVPYNAFMAARSIGLMPSKSIAGDGLTISVPQFSDLQREASGRLSSFRQRLVIEEGFNSFEAKDFFTGHCKSVWNSLGELHHQVFRGDKGPQD